MEVYILTEQWDNEPQKIMGVFNSKILANNAIKEIMKRDKTEHYLYQDFDILKYKINQY